MRTYARIQNGRVAELVTTSSDISTMFHLALTWVDASSVVGIEEGWTCDGSGFSKAAIPVGAQSAVTISEMQAQLAIFAAQLETLSKKGLN
jgi:hypothetical protein